MAFLDDCSNKITIQYPIMCENLRMPKSFDFLLVSNIEDAVISRRFLDTFHADPLIGFVVRPETIQRLPDTQFDNYQQNVSNFNLNINLKISVLILRRPF